MKYNEKTKLRSYKYHDEHIKRVPLDMQISDYEILKSAADAAGVPVNRYIKEAIKMRLEKEMPGE